MSPFAATTLVMVLFAIIWFVAKLVVVVADAIAGLNDIEAWHPVKRGMHIGAALLGSTIIAELVYVFYRILLTLYHGGLN